MTKSVTLNAIRKHDPCTGSWTKLLKHLGKTKTDDTEVPLAEILDLLGLDDALWALRALPPEMDGPVRLLICDLVEPAMQYTTDPRPAETLAVARRYAVGDATNDELATAEDAAEDAAKDAAWATAGDVAEDAAWAAAWATARAARDAAWATARAAAWAARDAARDAAGDAAWAAARAEQERIFRAWLEANDD